MPSDRVSSDDNKIRKYITELDHTIYTASHCYDIWWTFSQNELRVKYVDTMNCYVLFFQTSIHSHFVALIMALYKLYEKTRGTINFNELIKLLKKSNTFDKEIAEYNESLPSALNLWRKV